MAAKVARLAYLLLVAGCTAPTSNAEIYTGLRISADFTEAEAAAITRGIDRWGAVCPGLQLHGAAGPPNVVREPGPHPSHGQIDGARILAFVQGDVIRFFVDAFDNDGDLENVTVHEVGHWLGLPHDPDSGIMMPLYRDDNPNCIDREIAEQVCSDPRPECERADF